MSFCKNKRCFHLMSFGLHAYLTKNMTKLLSLYIKRIMFWWSFEQLSFHIILFFIYWLMVAKLLSKFNVKCLGLNMGTNCITFYFYIWFFVFCFLCFCGFEVFFISFYKFLGFLWSRNFTMFSYILNATHFSL